MNVKRYLKKQAKKDRQKILDADDKEFLLQLQSMVVERPKKRPQLRVWLPAALSAVAAAAVVVTCVVVYYPTDKHVEYFDVNLVYSDSSLDELNKDVKEVDLQIDSAVYTYFVKKMTDSVSGDVLYYSTKIEGVDNLVRMDIVTVCNPYYKYKDFSFTKETTETALDHYTVTYESTITANPEFGFETLVMKAQITKGQENIYIMNYNETLLSPEGSFFEILQSIVK